VGSGSGGSGSGVPAFPPLGYPPPRCIALAFTVAVEANLSPNGRVYYPAIAAASKSTGEGGFRLGD